jgi:taurine--2-oxoglutarate transaminase
VFEMNAPAVPSPAAQSSEDLKRWEREHVLHPWRMQGGDSPMIVRAKGTRFYDDAGKAYLDFTSQLAYANLGHAPAELAEVAAGQFGELPAMASMFGTPPKATLAKMLSEISPGNLNRSFFSTSGTEANEAALKLAREATGRPVVVSRYLSYHGSTMGSAAVSRDPRLGTSWQPDPGCSVAAYPPYCYRCPFGLERPSCGLRCAEHIRDLIRLNGPKKIAAVIVEPIIGANGVIVPPDGYLERLRQICDEFDVLLIADEVMVGFGRTGQWFACDHWKVEPDILTVSKGLTNGQFPMAATIIQEKIAKIFETKPFLHGHTASGNTTACAIGVRCIEIYREQNLVQRAAELGDYLLAKMRELQERHPCVGDVRGRGLFAGLELVRNRETKEPLAEWPQEFPVKRTLLTAVLARCREEGLFLMMAHPSVMHLAPPLTVTREEIDEAIAIIDAALKIADNPSDGGGTSP